MQAGSRDTGTPSQKRSLTTPFPQLRGRLSPGPTAKDSGEKGDSCRAGDTLNQISFLSHFLFSKLQVKERHPRSTYPLIDVRDMNRLKTDDTKEW